ncbi:family 43 glycosylhydrolase [Dysgonomonas termitidis]|uniref:beta-fructofuranosidase n=1 Tax=Dysgonomonas termitidis TaxID=1516126 RepID=A0ABV9KU42_9BACT
MKRIFFAVLVCILSPSLFSQVAKDYNPAIQRTTHFQYFKPVESHLFSGDCMPFSHNGTLYLYWLLDEGNHSGLNGLGGHQWALSTTTDLVNWKHYPVALGIDEEWEKSICTGSVIADGDKTYAFYSTRVKDEKGVHEQLSYAMSTDGGFTFKKQQPNPFYFAPEECVSRDFRDPRAFKDKDGVFHLFISGYEKNPNLGGMGGYLVHLTSKDLKNWTETESPLKGQYGVPECPDYFKWNDWYYLLYSIHGDTYYVKSKNPYGPWEYPRTQPMVDKWANVAKTAELNGRRIVAFYTNVKKNNLDSEGQVWGGCIVLRELFQQEDGALSVGYLPEVAPAMSPVPTPVISVPAISDNKGSYRNGVLEINASNGVGIASMKDLPRQYRITMTIEPKGNYDEFGLYMRATDKDKKGYKLTLNPGRQIVSLFESRLEGVDGLRNEVKLNAIVMDDIIDVYINNERCIINRLGEQKGENLFFSVKNGSIAIKDIKIYKIMQ